MNVIKMISQYNFNKGTIDRLNGGYLVIHYVGALGGAKSNCEYYGTGDRNASAHYFVDHNGDVYQCVEDQNIAWHCGATKYVHKDCRNANSIGIELCCYTNGNPAVADKDWYFTDATVSSAIALTKELMAKYEISADHVIRHYDVTGKTCPAPYVFNTGKHTWAEFKSGIQTDSIIQNGTNSQEDVAKIGWNTFMDAGFPAVTAAAWLGNLQAESGLKANNLQNSYEKTLGMDDETYTRQVDSGFYSKVNFYSDKAGYGLAQWTYWSRKRNMYEYIIEKLGKSIGDAKAQFEFLLHELQTSYFSLVTKLKQCTTVKGASDLILTEYERPADQSDSVKNKRAEYAQEFFNKFAGSSGVSSFTVRVDATDLNIRKGPGTDYDKTGKYTGKGVFTIVEVRNGTGAESGWGLLKSYQTNRDGWISLDYAVRLN